MARHDPAVPALICVYYPQQLVPAMAALLQYRQDRGLPADARVVVALWCPPALPEALVARRAAAVRRLLSCVPDVVLEVVDGQRAASVQSRWSVLQRARALAALMPEAEFGEILFAHDLTDDFFPQAAMQAWPHALRICYGDAWGVVYSNRHFERETFPLRVDGLVRPRRLLRNAFARCRRAVNRWPSSRMLREQLCMLILPLDPGGDVLSTTPQARVQPEIVRRAIALLVDSVAADLPGDHSGATLFLMGSYAESMLCTTEQELALYESAARRHVPSQGRILLKPHPAGSETKTQRLQEGLRALGYDAARLSPALDEVPVELLADVCAPSPILSFSYSSVSLTYLGYPTVVHALDADLIRRHFPATSVRWIQDSNQLYLGQMEAARALCEEAAA